MGSSIGAIRSLGKTNWSSFNEIVEWLKSVFQFQNKRKPSARDCSLSSNPEKSYSGVASGVGVTTATVGSTVVGGTPVDVGETDSSVVGVAATVVQTAAGNPDLSVEGDPHATAETEARVNNARKIRNFSDCFSLAYVSLMSFDPLPIPYSIYHSECLPVADVMRLHTRMARQIERFWGGDCGISRKSAFGLDCR
ncbi:MAG: hypothetical protein VW271_05010 [Chloroflexota bacterium]